MKLRPFRRQVGNEMFFIRAGVCKVTKAKGGAPGDGGYAEAGRSEKLMEEQIQAINRRRRARALARMKLRRPFRRASLSLSLALSLSRSRARRSRTSLKSRSKRTRRAAAA